MCPDFAEISISAMSNLKLLLVKDNKEEVEFNLSNRPITEFQAECYSIDLQAPDSRQQNREQRAKTENNKKEEECMRKTTDSFLESRKPPSLGDLKATGEDHDGGEDGFRTPTSLDHKIPAITQCPPAPRKAKPLPSLKRKASSINASRSLLLDLSQEVESLYSMPVLGGSHQDIKKARTDDDQPLN